MKYKQFIVFVDYGVEFRSTKPQINQVATISIERLQAKGINNAYMQESDEEEKP